MMAPMSLTSPLWKESETGSGTLLLRAEVRAEDTWDLAPLYTDDAAWEAEFQAVRAEFGGIADFRGRLGTDASTLRDAMEFDKSVSMRMEQLNQYAALRVTEDSSNGESLTRESRLQALFTRVGEAFSYISPEIMEIPDEVFERFLSDPVLSDWTIPLRKLRRLKAHTLHAREERLLALASASLQGHQETFSQLTNVDMKFGELADSEGRTRTLTQSSFSSFLEDGSPEVRRGAFKQFYAEFTDHQFALASSFASSVRSDVFHARARNYPSALEAALFHDDVPVAVYDNLIGSVHSHLEPLYRYYSLRKRLLKLPEIHPYDTFVPLVPEFRVRISFDEAIEKVCGALTPLGDDYVATLREGLAERRWCDRYENKGKRSGAFSYGTYSSPPYIMMNYKEDVFSDVYTLAHEAGHSMHTWFSQRNQSYQNYHYPIFLAEVASTFNECLLTDHLLRQTEDRRMRAFIISRQLNDIRSTLYRQTMFAEFEREVHAIEERDEALTLESFKKVYRALLERYFGPDVVLDPELDLECLRIPHFYNAFYVYKYATGLSAAIALSQAVQESGDAGGYLAFLKSGGSRFPIETLKAAGVDMGTPEPVDTALELFARRVGELEELLA